MTLLLPRPGSADREDLVALSPDDAGWQWTGLRVLRLPPGVPREVRTARLATLGSTARATAVTTVEYASSASPSSGRWSWAITH